MVHAFISSNHTTTPTMISLKTIRETWAKDRSGIFFVVAGDWEDVLGSSVSHQMSCAIGFGIESSLSSSCTLSEGVA